MLKKPPITTRATEKDSDMFGLKLTGGRTWSARLSIPRDRWQDVGLAYQTKSGIKQDAIMSLQTRDKNEAIQRRGAALEALRSQVNEKLAAIGKRPLEGDWKPRTVAERAVNDALSAKKVIAEASTAYSPDRNADGTVNENVPTNEQDHLHHVLTSQAEDVAESLSDEEGHQYLSTFMDTLEGTATPLGPLLDRWLASESKTVSNGLIDRHKRVLSVFGEYLASEQFVSEGRPFKAAEKGMPSRPVLKSFPVQKVDKKLARRFREWIEDRKAANTVNAYLSSLRSFWTWLVDAGEADSNPWAGMSRGLKKLAKRDISPDAEKRPFTEQEMLALLTGEPNSRDPRMALMLHDVFRLGLLTGARQNELCSLTVGRVVVPDNPEDELWGISITRDVAKTDNSVRTIPLHPLVRPIIERRLIAAKRTGEPDAPLFPECPPGGADHKRGWTFSKHFLRYRHQILGKEENGTDFHSTRRCFATFMETALANGAAACTELVCDHLIGHKSERLAANTYAAKRFDWLLYSEAIRGMVDKGVPERVKEALSC
ncbi:hypothetical protein AA0312_1625 [Acetobacter tropicalis NRIC 0312]|uniref:Integrase n=2 Tax=Acetobacter tropicalis TaxID=104102 RepID=A0A511FIW6_9PROT|nr:hypothetical protein GOX2232 [Acetobacter tropicalis]GBR69955.1 hypothetical protein AA0312_1625 [Acetobacter tropicalis NRIC 0312]GEL49163.1 hypothetical protein ATR01nite_02380 [Acetobacter tropicalis]